VSVPRAPGVPDVPRNRPLRSVPGTRAAHGGTGEFCGVPRNTRAPGVGASNGQAARASTEATASGDGRTAGPAVPRIEVVLPLHLAPVGNRREHHLARARRTRLEHETILGPLADYSPPALPAVVLLVRVGWNRLDVDGLVASVKGPIDALARWLRVDDRDPRVHWHLAQSVTRERRISRRTGRREAAAELRIVVRRWELSDGDDPLRVLAVEPAAEVKP
jgi:hypothetical protein